MTETLLIVADFLSSSLTSVLGTLAGSQVVIKVPIEFLPLPLGIFILLALRMIFRVAP